MNAYQTEHRQALVTTMADAKDNLLLLAESARKIACHEETSEDLVNRYTRLELALGGIRDVLEALQYEFDLADPEINDRHREVK